jgi:PIN domain nuclease of toxin-antitoxin system
VSILAAGIGLRVCDMPFRKVVDQAIAESWTRDPFDRLIVANAKAAAAPLVTRDERIRDNYSRALW